MFNERTLENYPTTACESFEDLREKYFLNLEDKIRSAESRTEAKMMLDQYTKEFFQQCESDMICLLFKRHAEALYERYCLENDNSKS